MEKANGQGFSKPADLAENPIRSSQYVATAGRKSGFYVFVCAVVAALGGFLFGFDTAVISGVEQSIQKLWNLDDFTQGLAVAIALYGTVAGAWAGGILADRFGRKMTLLLVGFLYIITSVGTAVAPEIWSFMFYRFLGGLGVGASSVAAPMYISEIAPAGRRGRLVALFQLNVVLGIVIAYVSNYLLKDIGESAWRWMLGVEAFPSVLYALMVLFIPESPRWLIYKKGNIDKAHRILNRIDPDNAGSLLSKIEDSTQKEKSPKNEIFFSRRNLFPISLAVLIAFFNQMVGINAIIYYAPRIFEMVGLANSSALFSTAGIGLANLLFTILGITMIDRFGRKTLMLIGSIGLVITLTLVAREFIEDSYRGIPLLLFAYIGFFALSQGAVIWVFISEIFPNRFRSRGQSLGSLTHWIMAAIVANIFPFFANRLGGGPVFVFFALMAVLQLLWVWKVMPETKGRSLEQLQEELISKNSSDT